MAAVMTFKRYELKYLMDEEQAEAVQRALDSRMVPDRYPHSSVRSLYYDTDSFLLARRSIEKPLYKEKLRLRSYGKPEAGGSIFVELKKKYDSVVYKRRLEMPLGDALEWLSSPCADGPDTQIANEIGFLRTRYPGIHPAMMLTYDRDAYRSADGDDLRITVDRNILARLDGLDLASEPGGRRVLPEGYTLMEIKTMNGYPGWLGALLSESGLFRSPFTKYGNAYKEMVLGKDPEEFAALRIHPAAGSRAGGALS
ncbi:MAG: polyphosphate polymerase domain-containing protein [Candidatus Methanomethylophilaceae archaeon]|nr:polyphosphate polymerase domain-containing protein [Candidatus Methanomethylophilaceae archaeon]